MYPVYFPDYDSDYTWKCAVQVLGAALPFVLFLHVLYTRHKRNVTDGEQGKNGSSPRTLKKVLRQILYSISSLLWWNYHAKRLIYNDVLNEYEKNLEEITRLLPVTDDSVDELHALCMSITKDYRTKLLRSANLDADGEDDALENIFKEGSADLRQRNDQAMVRQSENRKAIKETITVYQRALNQIVDQMPISNAEINRRHDICRLNAIKATDIDCSLPAVFEEGLADLKMKNHEAKFKQGVCIAILEDIEQGYQKELQQVFRKLPLSDEELTEQHKKCQENALKFKKKLIRNIQADVDIEAEKLDVIFEEGQNDLQRRNRTIKLERDAQNAILKDVANKYRRTLRQITSKLPLSDGTLLVQHGKCKRDTMDFKARILQYAPVNTDIDHGILQSIFADGLEDLKKKNIVAQITTGYGRGKVADTGDECAFLQDCKCGKLWKIVTYVKKGIALEVTDEAGWPGLLWASVYGHAATVRYLLNEGEDANRRTARGLTALHAACFSGHTHVVKILQEYGGDINIKTLNGRTCLMAASLNGHANTVRYLLEQGCEIKAQDEYGQSALYLACYSGHRDVIEILQAGGGDILMATKNGKTLLMVASQEGHVRTVRYLLRLGLDVNRREENGLTALHAACYNGHLEVVKVLMDTGADIFLTCNEGRTAHMVACEKGHIDVAQYLMLNGVDQPSTKLKKKEMLVRKIKFDKEKKRNKSGTKLRKR